jgi:hypothetical protein
MLWRADQKNVNHVLPFGSLCVVFPVAFLSFPVPPSLNSRQLMASGLSLAAPFGFRQSKWRRTKSLRAVVFAQYKLRSMPLILSRTGRHDRPGKYEPGYD